MKIESLLLSGFLLIPVCTLANSSFENQFQNVQGMKFNCADMNYGDSSNCYVGIERDLTKIADTVKGNPKDKVKISEWNNAIGAVNSAYKLCTKIAAINSPLSGAIGLSVGASCKVDIIALTPYKASQIFKK